MPRSAAAAEFGTNADKHACGDKRRYAHRRWTDERIAGQCPQARGSGNQTEDERQSPRTIARRRGREQAADNTADPGDAARQRHQQHRGNPNQNATDRGKNEGMHGSAPITLSILTMSWLAKLAPLL